MSHRSQTRREDPFLLSALPPALVRHSQNYGLTVVLKLYYETRSFNIIATTSSTKSSNHHRTLFQVAHLLEYSLLITQHDPKTLKVCSVRCQFCVFFGHEQIIGQKRQRKQTENEKYWGPPFRPQYYRDHHETQLLCSPIQQQLNQTSQFLAGRLMSTEDH